MRVALATCLVLVAACSVGQGAGATTSTPSPTRPAPIHLVFLGDVMLGRGVGDVAASDPGSIFERLRPVLAPADLALANLESPLTTRPHKASGYALEADPSVAALLATAGLDVVDLANNHATDAGPETVLDTAAAVEGAGLSVVGAGSDESAATAPLVLDVRGVRVGVLAFDMTGGGTAATSTSPGVSTWDRAAAEAAVTALRPEVDLLIVGVHGGVEYLPRPDPVLQRAVGDLATWGADVVWGHGAHVPYPMAVTPGEDPAVLAPGLGNAVFDQRIAGTDEGAVLEVIADADGVVAARTGTVTIRASRSSFTGWAVPAGDAVALRSDWWTPARPITDAPPSACDGFDLATVVAGLPAGSEPVATACGPVTDPSASEMVVAYRRPFTSEPLQALDPDRRWADAQGRSAHLAVMTPEARMVWGAGTLVDPIGAVAVCSGSVAVGYTTLDDPALVAASAWTWRSFGFATAPPLTHPTAIGCTDLDHDGATEPYVLRSST